jgi:hypothetical protein
MVVLLVVVLLGVAMLVVVPLVVASLALLAGGDRPSRAPRAVVAARAAARTPSLALAPSQRGQLVFARPLGQGRVGLDCLLSQVGESDRAGQPVHVVAVLPDSPWLAEVDRVLVERWLTQGAPVDIELSCTPSHPRVTLACDRTTLQLELQSA